MNDIPTPLVIVMVTGIVACAVAAGFFFLVAVEAILRGIIILHRHWNDPIEPKPEGESK